jgi:hypothetical protein
VAVVFTVAVVVHAVAPLWVQVTVALTVLVAWAVRATCPAGIPLRRHLAAVLAQMVLDAVRSALRAVLAMAVAVAVLASTWSFLAPRLAAAVTTARDQAVSGVRDAVTPTLPTCDLGAAWRRLTHPTPDEENRP